MKIINRPKTISPSQLRKWRSCPRSWGIEKLCGVKSAPSQSLIVGTKVHEHLENFITSRAVPPTGHLINDPEKRKEPKDPGTLARLALPILRELPKDTRVEEDCRFEADGISWFGRVDLQYTTSHGTPVVWDHKTSTDPRKWGLTSKTLGYDVQALVYAKWKFSQDPKLKELILKWMYIPTSKSAQSQGATVVSSKITREELDTRWIGVHKDAKALWEAIQTTQDVQQLTANPEACSQWGGCPHRESGRCSLDQEAHMFDNFETPDAPDAPPPPPQKSQDRLQLEALCSVEGIEYGPHLTDKALIAMLEASEDAPGLVPPVKEAPPPPPSAPDTSDPATTPLEAMDRAQLKAIAVAKDLVPSNTRLKKKGLLELLEGHAPKPEPPTTAETDASIAADAVVTIEDDVEYLDVNRNTYIKYVCAGIHAGLDATEAHENACHAIGLMRLAGI